MSSNAGVVLISKLLDIARGECTKQQDDLDDEIAWEKMASLGVYRQLQTRYHDQLSARYIGEDDNAAEVNWSNCEGEYKFWDKGEMAKFMKIDGMPTAARALLFTMAGNHEMCESPPIWMGFTGIIDEDFGRPTPRPIRLQSILRPLKFWEDLDNPSSDDESERIDIGSEITAGFCKPYRSLAVDIVRNAPHMLKPGYVSARNKQPNIQRFSWGRLMVLLFLPEDVLMEELAEAGLSHNLPAGWYQRARDNMKDTLLGVKNGSDRSYIEDHWEGLCAELDECYVSAFSNKGKSRDRIVRSTSPSPPSSRHEESAH